MIPFAVAGGETVIQLGELVMIVDLLPAGAERIGDRTTGVGIDRRTVRKYIERGLETANLWAAQGASAAAGAI
jgi:hypothetical protein